MKDEIKKIGKIVEEVITFFMYNYEVESNIEIKYKEKVIYMTFRFFPVNINEKELIKLKKRFPVSRRPEMENYYWHLAGEVEDSSGVTLVCMMCDTCDMKVDNKTLMVELTRKIE
ncbi:hypothetical protein M0P98_04835 [bacterium]|nr:hypothetical protein [bacterium]